MSALNDEVDLCWICQQSLADTSEHRLKRSDLRAIFGDGTKLHIHTRERVNKHVQSLNSNLLKFKKSICYACNGARTQPHDRAWERLSANLQAKEPSLKPGDYKRCEKVFPYRTSQNMLGAHLFFVKWLGCQIVESRLSVTPGVDTFSAAIMAGKAHPNVWIAFGRTIGRTGASDLDGGSFRGCLHYLARFYCIGGLAVRVRLSNDRIPGDWHPSRDKRFQMMDFRFQA